MADLKFGGAVQNSDDWDFHWRSLEPVTNVLPSQAFRHRIVVREVIRAQPNYILDLGCGQGDLLERLSRHFDPRFLAGLEQSAIGVETAIKKVPEADIHQFDLLCEEPSLIDCNFECLTCVEVLEHVDDPVEFLRSAVTHLLPGGRVVITVPSGPRTAFDISIGHRRHFHKQDLRSILDTVGLVNVRVRRVGFPFFDLYRLVVLLRGRKLVSAVVDSSLDQSRVARFVMFVFALLLRVNPNFIPFGLQLIATADKPDDSIEASHWPQ